MTSTKPTEVKAIPINDFHHRHQGSHLSLNHQIILMVCWLFSDHGCWLSYNPSPSHYPCKQSDDQIALKPIDRII